MKRIVFIVGGVRSGKSRYAVDMAKKMKKKTAFIATAVPSDKEMEKRIRLHQRARPRHWKLIEEGKNIDRVLPDLEGKHDVVLIDCLGLLVSNLMAQELKDREIERKMKKLINVILNGGFTAIVVSNEVGSSLVPVNPLARRFQDLVGLTNQMVAKSADEVIFMHAGIPTKIKGGKK